MLKLTNVFAGYGGGDVLKGVDLEVEKGSLTCIVGPNGAGKSTVLRMISGLLKPRGGTVTFDGQSIVGMTAPHILQLGIAQIPQEHTKTLVQVFETIRQMHRAGTTVLLVEQNVRAGLAIATYGVVMESGRVRMQGPAGQVREDPEMGHLFFGGTLSGA